MEEFLQIWQLLNESACEVRLIDLWMFIVLLGCFIWMNSKRGIVLTSFAGSLYIGVWQNIEFIQASLVASPVLWIPYLGMALFIILGVSFSLAWDQ